MIFPFLNGICHPFKAPLTYFLLFINVVVFLGTYDNYVVQDQHLDEIVTNDQYLAEQGFVFGQMIIETPSHFSNTLVDLAKQMPTATDETRQMLGSLALRSSEFMARADSYVVHGDEIELADWRAKFQELKNLQDEHPSFQWGMSRQNAGWMQWFTYQFAHSGFAHLFWNMVFLMIFGCFVETTLGGTFVVLAYLGGGLAGAWSFSLLSGFSASPLIGASASVSGIMGLVAFAWWKTSGVRFFYWLLPVQGYFGFRLLPSWLVLVVSLLPDLSGYLSSTPEVGSVAYSAHLGGTAFGAIVAFMLSRRLLVREVDAPMAQSDDDQSSLAA